MDVGAQIVTLRLAETFVIARESQDAADVVHVTIEHQGLVGRGEAAPIDRYDETAESARAFVEEHGGLVGDDPFALEEIGARLAELPGEQAAKAALDAALHDLQGKLLGVPAWRLLGLPRTGPPTSFTIWLGDPDDMARRTERVAPRFRRLKLKLGGGDGLDVERVRAVRAVTELPLMVDVNEWWSLDEALDAVPRLAELGVQYVEQPLRAETPTAACCASGRRSRSTSTRTATRWATSPPAPRSPTAINIKLAKSGGDPGGDSHRPRRARARARRDARLHGRVGARDRRRLPGGPAL